MAILTEVGALSGPDGAPCTLSVIRGLLHQNVRLELFSEDGWKPLVSARVIYNGEPAEGVCYLHTPDRATYQARPGDPIRVRFPQNTKGR